MVTETKLTVASDTRHATIKEDLYVAMVCFLFAVLYVYRVLLKLFSYILFTPGRVAQSVGHLTRKPGVLGSIPGLATYFRFSFRFFKKGSCQLLAKVCAQSTG